MGYFVKGRSYCDGQSFEYNLPNQTVRANRSTLL